MKRPIPKLFAPDTAIEKNAHLDRVYGSWWCYANAYFRAATLLARRCRTFGDRATLSHPVIFLYRQYVELVLKYMVLKGNRVLEKKRILPKKGSAGHDLTELWNISAKILAELQLSPSLREELPAIEQRVTELASIDPLGDGFRFPDSKAARPPEIISLPRLVSGMNALKRDLTAAAGLIDATIDHVNEFRDECGPYWK